jgi:hypothetical protein
MKTRLILSLFPLLLGCTTTSVVPVSNEPLSLVCIQRNPDVGIDDFVAVVQQRFAYHGIKTLPFDGQRRPVACIPFITRRSAHGTWAWPMSIDLHLRMTANGRRRLFVSGDLVLKDSTGNIGCRRSAALIV